MRRIISPWEYRHLRAWAAVRIGGGIVAAVLGAFVLSEVSGAWTIFGALLLAAGAANFWFACRELSRSFQVCPNPEPGQTPAQVTTPHWRTLR